MPTDAMNTWPWEAWKVNNRVIEQRDRWIRANGNETDLAKWPAELRDVQDIVTLSMAVVSLQNQVKRLEEAQKQADPPLSKILLPLDMAAWVVSKAKAESKSTQEVIEEAIRVQMSHEFFSD